MKEERGIIAAAGKTSGFGVYRVWCQAFPTDVSIPTIGKLPVLGLNHTFGRLSRASGRLSKPMMLVRQVAQVPVETCKVPYV